MIPPRLLRVLPTWLIVLGVIALGIAVAVIGARRRTASTAGASTASQASASSTVNAGASPAPPIASQSNSLSAASPAAISGRDRFAAEETLAVNVVADANGAPAQRQRLVHLAKSPAHLVRAVDHLEHDPA